MKKQSFAKGAVILAVCSMLAKVLGGAYRIFLTNILGSEGIGYYQLVFPFFALMLALLTNALPITLSRLISSKLALSDKGSILPLVGYAARYALIAGILGMIFSIAISRLLASAQSQVGVYICYVAIAPAILFVALSGVFKGWFLGHGNMNVVATSQIIEIVAKLAIGLAIASYMLKFGLLRAVASGLFAVSISEFVCFLYVFFCFLSSKRQYSHIQSISSHSKSFFASFVPITMSGLIFPVVAFLDSLIVVNLLRFGGITNAVEQYGLLTGPVNSVVNMPIVIAMSVAVAIVPAVASALSNYDVVSIKHKTCMSIKVCIAIAMPFFLGGAFLSRQVIDLLYPNLGTSHTNLTWILLSVSSANILILTILEVFNAILMGLGRQKPVLVNVALSGAIKIVLELLLVPRFGIIASAFSNIAFYGIAMLLNGLVYQKLVGHNSFLIKSISKICVSGVIMSVAVALGNLFSSNILAILWGVLAGGSAYMVALLLLRAVSLEEIQLIPFGKKLSNILVKTKLFGQKKENNL